MINFLNLKEQLKSTQFPALCLFGNDRWVKLKAVATVCNVYGISDDMFGVDNLNGAVYNDIEAACLTPSLFSSKKLVVCDNFVFPQGKQQQETVAKLSRLVNSCDGSFCLVFLADAPAVFEKISGLAMVDCNKLDNNSVAKWIVAYGKRQGVAIDSICAKKIGDYCLQDMSRVASETQKLIDYGEVSLNSVELLVHKDTEYQIFDLTKYIAGKNAQVAVELYKGLVASGEEARGLFGLMYNTYRRAYYVKTSEFPSEKLAELLSVKPYAVEKTKEIANNYKPMQLKRILNFFDEADKKLKAFLDETEVMTTLIMQIVSV